MSCFLTLQIFSPILFYVNSFTNNELCILFVKDQISISLVHLLYFPTKRT